MGLAIDPDIKGSGGPWAPPLVGDTYARIQACGTSFERGIFKFHDSVSGPRAEAFLKATLDFDGPVEPFAFDWLGRQYCVLAASLGKSGQPEVALIDPFDMSAEPLVLRGEFLGFLSSPVMLEVIEQPLFQRWLDAAGVASVGFDQCAGAIQPAFLGGVRAVGNLELSDIEVYWAVMRQAALAAAPLADGEKLESL
ncbi:hypothetical protein [Phycicoccus sp.]|uniref:hypothetical protein n=1 Tax=Phycicoccus sp. TaxID=1902410 RepID=UPI00345E20F4